MEIYRRARNASVSKCHLGSSEFIFNSLDLELFMR